MKIKVCGTRDKENLEGILQLHPDFVGFIFYDKSPRFVNEIPDIPNWPREVKRVGVFVDESLESMLDTAATYKLDFIQLHGNESPEMCVELKDKGLGVIKVFSITDDFDFLTLEPYKPFVDYFLFDTPSVGKGGSGQVFNWDLLKRYDQQIPFFLSGGIGPMHAEVVKSDWVQQFNPYALDINSRFETAPGVKNVEWLKLFFDKIREN